MPSPKLRAKRHPLTGLQVIELRVGPPPSGSTFASDAERRAAWEAYRASALARTEERPTPWAFWEYETPAHLHADHTSEEGWRDFAARRAAWLAEHPFRTEKGNPQ